MRAKRRYTHPVTTDSPPPKSTVAFTAAFAAPNS